MIPIDLHPNLAPVRTLVSCRRLTLYLDNQTGHNWLFVALIRRGGGACGWMEEWRRGEERGGGHPFLFAVIKHIPSLLAPAKKNE